jgi:hypothetical protein
MYSCLIRIASGFRKFSVVIPFLKISIAPAFYEKMRDNVRIYMLIRIFVLLSNTAAVYKF